MEQGGHLLNYFLTVMFARLTKPQTGAWLADASEKDHDINKTDAIALLEKLTASNWENEDPVGYETAFSAEEKEFGAHDLKGRRIRSRLFFQLMRRVL